MSKYNRRLGYVDCFAGGGSYVDEAGRNLPGSPRIALDVANGLVAARPNCSFLLGFSERNRQTADYLRRSLAAAPLNPAVRWAVHEEPAADFIRRLVDSVRSGGLNARIIPTFFFIDPYGHPISVPVMRGLLALGKTELLVNLMWFRLNMHLSNPSEQRALDNIFGHTNWRSQPFVTMRGIAREHAFVEYFEREVGAGCTVRLAMPFSPEDPIPGGERRSKFHLIHFSNHPLAARVMKRVMQGAEEDLRQISKRGKNAGEQLALIARPDPSMALRDFLVARYRGKKVTFEQILIDDLHDLSRGEPAYRAVIKYMEADGTIRVIRVTSRLTGIKGRDRIIFPA